MSIAARRNLSDPEVLAGRLVFAGRVVFCCCCCCGGGGFGFDSAAKFGLLQGPNLFNHTF